jgi:hypothetical protein
MIDWGIKMNDPLQLYQITIFSFWQRPVTIEHLTLEQAVEQKLDYQSQQFKVELSKED